MIDLVAADLVSFAAADTLDLSFGFELVAMISLRLLFDSMLQGAVATMQSMRAP
jgi:hypothetical protein